MPTLFEMLNPQAMQALALAPPPIQSIIPQLNAPTQAPPLPMPNLNATSNVPVVPEGGGGASANASSFLQDPNFKQALMAFGASMLKGQQPGQTGGSVIGSSIMDAMQIYNNLKGQQAAGARADRKLDITEGSVAEGARQFDENEPLRKAEERVKLSRAALNDRLPVGQQGGSGAQSKTAKEDLLAKAYIAAEDAAIANGTLDPKDARYQNNSALAVLDAVAFLNKDDPSEQLITSTIPQIASIIDMFREQDQQKLTGLLTDAQDTLKGLEHTTRFTTKKSEAGAEQGIQGDETVLQIATDAAGNTLHLKMVDGALQWVPATPAK